MRWSGNEVASAERHWVIGDVHGCHASLIQLLAVLPTRDHLVLCGDVINRGPGIADTLHLVWELVCNGRATWLRGNHEQNLIEALEQRSSDAHQSLLRIDTYRQLGDGLTRQWLQRLQTLPDHYRGKGWIATHAGFDPQGRPDLRIREPFWETYDGRFGRVVVGHTPRPSVERRQHIVMIDTGAVYGGRLSAFCPETDAVVQVMGQTALAIPAPQHQHQQELIESTSC
ncbi:metallophosphoesterase [Synechococcus sp. HK01-R]|jgi:serine/threonine protein phosphatase 1|nr:metallophosphoesterase [Synechococcus sp. HK01-R]